MVIGAFNLKREEILFVPLQPGQSHSVTQLSGLIAFGQKLPLAISPQSRHLELPSEASCKILTNGGQFSFSFISLK
ncbi:hypothetical protein B0F87_10313 [Methylobacter tundripaludum]|uniref:Uncharacterized protein n=1 Tax=Methylobacter tundripaludum TaxID=173365 RepID=A0A2S6HFZ6_9GAMM|nr:hypothetical protein [Methylobacter tundripaludum]PPK76408.1 hypothetical protein B0F87_10313 [Methylobacter tundripaludum]